MEAKKQDGSKQKSGRVLVIDDDEQLCRMMSRLLSDSGYQVTLARDGDEGLKESRRQTFDLIITDLVMARADGLEVICEVKEDQPDAKIIAVSGGDPSWKEGKETYLDVANRLGAIRCFEKPLDPDSFLEAVDEVIFEKRQLH